MQPPVKFGQCKFQQGGYGKVRTRARHDDRYGPDAAYAGLPPGVPAVLYLLTEHRQPVRDGQHPSRAEDGSGGLRAGSRSEADGNGFFGVRLG